MTIGRCGLAVVGTAKWSLSLMNSSVDGIATAAAGIPVDGNPPRNQVNGRQADAEAPRSGEVVGAETTEGSAAEAAGIDPQASDEAAQRLAEQLERAINDAHGTQVKFRVQTVGGETRALSFAVIERETGKVVREFPPEEAVAAVQRAQQAAGVLVDQSA